MSKSKEKELSPVEKAVISFVVSAVYELAKREVKRRLDERKKRRG